MVVDVAPLGGFIVGATVGFLSAGEMAGKGLGRVGLRRVFSAVYAPSQ